MLVGRRKRFLREVELLVAAIDENRFQLHQARRLMGGEARRPALWLDMGRRTWRVYSHTRTISVLFFQLLRFTRVTRLLRVFRLLPLVGAGWGAYRLMRR